MEADPGLGEGLDPAGLTAARHQVLARLLRLAPGPWAWRPDVEETHGHLGLLVLEGLLIRSEAIGGFEYPELLGGNDLLRPWTADSHATHPTGVSWDVLAPTRVAILDREFALRAKAWPEIVAALLDRAVMRSRTLSLNLAINRAVRIEERLELVLWHLADRWGHVTSEGTVLPVPLTHEALAKLVCARRSPVTVAVGNLKRKGTLRRGSRGSWVLSGEARRDGADARRV